MICDLQRGLKRQRDTPYPALYDVVIPSARFVATVFENTMDVATPLHHFANQLAKIPV